MAALEARFLLQRPNIYGVISALRLHSSGFLDVTYDGLSLEAIHRRANRRPSFLIISYMQASCRYGQMLTIGFSDWYFRCGSTQPEKKRPRAHSKASLICDTADDLLLASGYFHRLLLRESRRISHGLMRFSRI